MFVRLVLTFVVLLISFGGVHAADVMSVLKEPLAVCSTDPMTGFYREGKCETGPSDHGTHTVCAQVTDAFLQYTLKKGNDLITPRPEYSFPGLKAGDRWCLCALRWTEALKDGVAPPVVLSATHEKTLQYTDIGTLKRHSVTEGQA